VTLGWQDSNKDDLYKLSKLGQTDLVFGSWSEFISRSVHAGLQVSMCSGYDLCHPG